MFFQNLFLCSSLSHKCLKSHFNAYGHHPGFYSIGYDSYVEGLMKLFEINCKFYSFKALTPQLFQILFSREHFNFPMIVQPPFKVQLPGFNLYRFLFRYSSLLLFLKLVEISYSIEVNFTSQSVDVDPIKQQLTVLYIVIIQKRFNFVVRNIFFSTRLTKSANSEWSYLRLFA